jgi:hypothetical protein
MKKKAREKEEKERKGKDISQGNHLGKIMPQHSTRYARENPNR